MSDERRQVIADALRGIQGDEAFRQEMAQKVLDALALEDDTQFCPRCEDYARRAEALEHALRALVRDCEDRMGEFTPYESFVAARAFVG